MSVFRVKVACINWGHEDAPHSLAYVVHVGTSEMVVDRFFGTWGEALSWGNEMARRLPIKAGGVGR